MTGGWPQRWMRRQPRIGGNHHDSRTAGRPATPWASTPENSRDRPHMRESRRRRRAARRALVASYSVRRINRAWPSCHGGTQLMSLRHLLTQPAGEPGFSSTGRPAVFRQSRSHWWSRVSTPCSFPMVPEESSSGWSGTGSWQPACWPLPYSLRLWQPGLIAIGPIRPRWS